MQSDIILVSDQPAGLELIVHALREIASGRELRILFNQEEALDLIEQEQIELVFCYLSSGALASTFFLNDVWKRNPRSARFLLDSSADSEALLRCLLGAHHFIETPVDAQKLRAALHRAESTKQFVRNDKIQALASRMRTLPSRPSIYMEVMREIHSPGASVASVSEVVAKDLSVSTKLIQLADSGFFGSAQPVTDISEAVLKLGLETTGSVVMSIEAFARFDKVKPLWFSVEKVWKHTQVVANVARQLAQRFSDNPQVRGDAYLAALLHDIGKLTFAENFGDEYSKAARSAEEQGRPLFELEHETFQATHADTGAYLLALWGLPIPVVQAVASHHALAGTLGSTFTPGVAVHLAEQLVAARLPIEETLLAYPPELGLREHADFLIEILPASARLKATAAAVPRPAAAPKATAHPAPEPPKNLISRICGGFRNRVAS